MDVQLDALLTIKGVLGAIAVDRRGQVLAHSALTRADAELVSTVASTIFVDLAHSGEPGGSADLAGFGPLAGPEGATPRSYATFELRKGQIHLSAGRELALILLTEPGFDQAPVRDLLAGLVADLERSLSAGPGPRPDPPRAG